MKSKGFIKPFFLFKSKKVNSKIMKKITLLLFALSITSFSFAQTVLGTAKLKKSEVPTEVLESVKEDFPNGTMSEIYGIPVQVLEDEWYFEVNQEDTDTDLEYGAFSVMISTKEGTRQANYDRKGNLINTVEKLKNIALPRPIENTIKKHYAGWSVVKDKARLITYHRKDRKKAHYKVWIAKNGVKEKLVFYANGNILSGKLKGLYSKG